MWLKFLTHSIAFTTDEGSANVIGGSGHFCIHLCSVDECEGAAIAAVSALLVCVGLM